MTIPETPLRGWDWHKPSAIMIGRFQPWHEGHRKLFERAIWDWGQVCILVRIMPRDSDNPFSYDKVAARIHSDLAPFFEGCYRIGIVPNTGAVVYGRDVGYSIVQYHLDEATEAISATDIREDMCHIVRLDRDE
jgi:hypothetical protein